MTFHVITSDLASRLSAISRVISGKNTMPILDNFLFNVSGETLTITGSDGDTTVTATVPITEPSGDGSFAVPVKTIMDPLRDLPSQEIIVSFDEKHLQVSVDYVFGSFSFVGVSASEYPAARALAENAKRVTMPAQLLYRGIKNTVFATSDDEMRPVMCGILFGVKSGVATFVATDSKILVRHNFSNGITGDDGQLIVPKKPARLIADMVGKDSGDVRVEYDNAHMKFTLKDYTLICRQIEGKYPRYEAVIPKSNTNVMTVERQPLMSALRRMQVFSSSATNQVKFELKPRAIVISSQDVDFSVSGNESVPCAYTGTPMAIGFRAGYLLSVLGVTTSKEVEFKMGDASRPALVSPSVQDDGEDLLLLVSPMHLN